ncbi:hypothetical protein, partial [Providencia stuartii]
FRIHALPTIRISLYKRVIKFLSDMSTHTIFLDKPVLDFFIDNNLVNINKSKVLIGRTINHANHSVDFSSRSSDNKFKLTYIGALNDEKDLLPIIKGLSSQKIPGLELGFYSKGIKKYKNELEALTIIYPSTEIIDSFLSREEYDSIIHRSDALILPYKKTYGVRFSAVLNDALRLGKPVLTINLPQFKYYKDKYNACSLYSDHNEIIKSVTSLINNPDIDIDLLNYDYSERIKEKQIKELEL